MDHPLPAPETLVRPWRTAAFVASAVAAVELLVLLVIGGGALLGVVSHRVEHAATQHALGTAAAPGPTRSHAARKAAPAPKAKLSRSHTRVLVLNGNGRTGAAAAAAARVRRHGYRVGGVGNAPRPAARSVVMYRRGFAGEGRRLAHDVHVKIVGPLDGLRRSDLRGAQVVLVLGP